MKIADVLDEYKAGETRYGPKAKQYKNYDYDEMGFR